MKANLFAVCLTLIFAFTAIVQAQEDTQNSPSDDSIVVPSEIAPSDNGISMASEWMVEDSGTMMIESGMPLPMLRHGVATADCVQMMPVNCCPSYIMPVVYQQQITSSPLPTTPAAPTPISNQIGISSVLQNPITNNSIITPIQQSSPFIQPSNCGASGQIIGNQVSSPTIVNNPIIAPITPINPTNSTVGSTVPSTVIPSTTSPVDGTNWVQPTSSNWYPATSFDYNYGNYCPQQNRGFVRGGRFFGRWR